MATPCVTSTGSDQDLFTYTAGRYIFNEKRRLEERYAEFEVEALKTVAASSVGRDAVAQIKKLAEGDFNRVFVLTMSDGFKVIAKIPYPITVPKKLATGSEVATLDFLRTRGIPVPQVYAYSSESNNAVGTEYIVMENAPGQPLDRRWFDLTPKERVWLVTSYVDIERKLFSIPFGSYGSLYYTQSDLPRIIRFGGSAPPLIWNAGLVSLSLAVTPDKLEFLTVCRERPSGICPKRGLSGVRMDPSIRQAAAK